MEKRSTAVILLGCLFLLSGCGHEDWTRPGEIKYLEYSDYVSTLIDEFDAENDYDDHYIVPKSTYFEYHSQLYSGHMTAEYRYNGLFNCENLEITYQLFDVIDKTRDSFSDQNARYLDGSTESSNKLEDSEGYCISNHLNGMMTLYYGCFYKNNMILTINYTGIHGVGSISSCYERIDRICSLVGVDTIRNLPFDDNNYEISNSEQNSMPTVSYSDYSDEYILLWEKKSELFDDPIFLNSNNEQRKVLVENMVRSLSNSAIDEESVVITDDMIEFRLSGNNELYEIWIFEPDKILLYFCKSASEVEDYENSVKPYEFVFDGD